MVSVSILRYIPCVSLSRTDTHIYLKKKEYVAVGSVEEAWHAFYRNTFPNLIIIKIIEASMLRLEGLCVHECKGRVWFLPHLI